LVDSTGAGGGDAQGPPALTDLFHRLNNQLSVILAHGELVETKVDDEAIRARAALIVQSAIDAIDSVRAIRARVEGDPR
jgi:hypothetical protein